MLLLCITRAVMYEYEYAYIQYITVLCITLSQFTRVCALCAPLRRVVAVRVACCSFCSERLFSFAVHPGTLLRTRLQRHSWLAWLLALSVWPFTKSLVGCCTCNSLYVHRLLLSEQIVLKCICTVYALRETNQWNGIKYSYTTVRGRIIIFAYTRTYLVLRSPYSSTVQYSTVFREYSLKDLFSL